jgi:haloacetate dehalogenase
MNTLFPNTRELRFQAGTTEIFARVGGHGPPLLLLHGYPQTHAMWHRIAPQLMAEFTCVMPDLRGYGFSSCPANDPENFAYSKRAMAGDVRQLMQSLGHRHFSVVGHDRGARVAYRMALDTPDSVQSLAILDIVPTYDMWHNFTVALAMKTYHWLFLAQPNPLPEMLIEPNPVAYLDYMIASWAKAKDLSSFDPAALAEYRLHFATPEHVHATCNDYRAGQTYDLKADEADRAANRKIDSPTLVLWGDAGIPATKRGGDDVEADDPLKIWGAWCSNLRGSAIDSGHFIPEENPEQTLAQLLPFLREFGRQ